MEARGPVLSCRPCMTSPPSSAGGPRRDARSGRADLASQTAWFPSPRAAAASPLRAAALEIGLPVVAVALLAAWGHRAAAAVVAVLALALLASRRASPRARAAIDRGLQSFASLVGRAVSWALLAPVFLVGMTGARALQRLSGRDPLLLARGPRPTFWLAPDSSARKDRHVRATFATEPLDGSRRGWAAVALVLLACLVAAELGLRVAGFGRPVLYRSDVFAGYVPAPSQATRRSGGLLRINSLGMRGPEVSASPAPGTLRILLVGDSTLYGGSYVSNDELYARQLEAALNGAGLGRRVEVAALGVNGWGPFHQLGWLRSRGTLGAEIVVACIPLGDIHRRLHGLEAMPFMTDRHPPRLALEEVLFHLTWRWRASRLDDISGDGSRAQAEAGLAAYRELAAFAREAGAREVRFALLPRQGGDDPEWLARLREAVEPVSDGFDYPAELFAGRSELYHDVAHLSVEGHAAYAEHLARLLLETSPVLAEARGARDGGAP